MKKNLLTMLCALSAVSHLLASENEEWWRCPRDADAAEQELERQFDVVESTIFRFEISGVPVQRALVAWKTFSRDNYGYLITHYHWRTFDFLHNTLLYRSDY
jgi:hypothetical protein